MYSSRAEFRYKMAGASKRGGKKGRSSSRSATG